MKPIDPEKTEIALGLRRIDIRTTSRFVINTNNPEEELRLAKNYWLKTIQPYIAGRSLRGAELHIASDGYIYLKGAADFAARWNSSEEGKDSPVPLEIFPDWEKEEFREPEELIADENLKPEILAGIAATLVKTERKKTPSEAVRDAHELLLAAERYIGTLPKQTQSRESIKQFEALLERYYGKVTFEEILHSNEKNSGHLPLLPPVQNGRNEGRLTMNALKTAVKRFLQEHIPSITQETFEHEEREREMTLKKNKEDFEKSKGDGTILKMSQVGNGISLTYLEWQKLNQDSINDILENNRISAHLIAVMRWERFKNFCLKQQNRVQKNKSG